MTRRRIKRITQNFSGSVMPFPLDAETWARVVEEFGLPRQQARIVKGILCGMGDKQIARELGLRVPTVRTYLGRIFDRLGVGDRVQVILRVLAQARSIASDEVGHRK